MSNRIVDRVFIFIDNILDYSWNETKMSKYIKFNINLEKDIESILWFANKKANITYYEILKLIFYAEDYHLRKYGRPIIGDKYIAMDFGPVASMTYDMLKKNKNRNEITNLVDSLPFDTNNTIITPHRESNPYFLSNSNIEALEYSWNTYKDYNFGAFKDSTHEHPTWKNARAKRNILNKNPLINYADFFDQNNCDKVDELLKISEHLSL